MPAVCREIQGTTRVINASAKFQGKAGDQENLSECLKCSRRMQVNASGTYANGSKVQGECREMRGQCKQDSATC